MSGNFELALLAQRHAVRREAPQPEARVFDVVYATQVVIDPLDLEPLGLRRHHAPGREIVDCGSPEHRFLSARVHCDVAADRRGVGGGRIDCEYEPGGLRCLHHATRHHARAGANRRDESVDARQRDALDFGQSLELLGIEHRGAPRQRNRPARVTRTATARDDRDVERGQRGHQRLNRLFALGRDHDEGVFDPPVGSIRDM